ncbi:uncharacterized protein [Oscarella lobularis]|uniref:uncharacterized protein isoform X2 n=1 Tax=Oscarella lobularis TaxID=121494 RepID=UPI0033140F40
MAPIDRCRGFIFGMDSDDDSHSFVLNLYSKSWLTIDFDVKPHPRFGDSSIMASEVVYVLDIDSCKGHKINVGQEFDNTMFATSHCVQNEDKTFDVLVYDDGLKFFHLGLDIAC